MKQITLLLVVLFCVATMASAQITTYPHFENFDNYTSNGPYQCAATVPLNNGWSNETSTTEGANNGDWSNYSWSTPTVGTGPTTDHTGNGGYFIFTSSFSCFNSYRHLRSPTFDFTNLTHPQLNFWYFAYGKDIGTMTLEVSSDGGTTWSEVFFAVTENEGNLWKEATINLCAYGGQSAVMFRFVALTGSTRYSDFAIDDVSMSNVLPVSCQAVTDVRVASTTATDLTVQWADQCGVNYNWEVVPFGNAQGVGVLQSGTTSNTNVTLTNLTPVTAYHFYIKTFCTTDSSSYAGPFLLSSGCNSALSGTYQIGGNTPNFTTINAAINSLITCGMSGSIVFDIAPGIYKENLVIPLLTGVSSTNTVTFQGQNVATTIIEHDALSATVQNSTILLDQAQYMTFKHLTITNKDSIYDAWVIHLFDNAKNNTIDSCLILMDTVFTSGGINDSRKGIIATDDNGPHSNFGKRNASHTLITNTHFIGGSSAIIFGGDSETQTSRNTNNQIINCQINAVYYQGIGMRFQESPVISGNTITFSTSDEGDGIGIGISQSKEPIIAKNLIIDAPDRGITLYNNNLSQMNPVNSIKVSNNMVTTVNDGFGVGLFGNKMLDFYYNTIHSSRTALSSTNTDHSTDNIKNNIFSKKNNDIEGVIRLYDTLAINSTAFDYNIYNHDVNTNIAKIGTVAYATLTDWNTYTPLNNTNSLVGNPLFYPNDDLHLQGTLADSAALVISNITVDIDGDIRDALFPDIGADEYIPLSCLPVYDLSANNITGTSAELKWAVSGEPLFWEIEYGLIGFPTGNGTIIQTTDSVFLLTNLTQLTDYSYRTRSVCGVGDTSFWSTFSSFTTVCDVNVPIVLPFLEDFENTTNTAQVGSAMVHCSNSKSWKFETGSPNGRMQLGTTSPVNNGGLGALLMDCSVPNVTINNFAILTLDMSSYIGFDNIELSFDLKNYGNTTTSSNNKVWIRGNIANDWVELHDWRISNATIFKTVNNLDIDKTLLNAGQTFSSSFQIKIGQADYYDYPSSGTVFDNIKIDTVACSQPLLLSTNHIGATSADLVWSEGGSATSWEVEWGLNNFMLGNGTRVSNLTDTTLAITGLLKDREYNFYVRANCGTNSNWTGPYSFRTMCDIFSFFPYTENFSIGNNTVNCWRTYAEVGSGTWEFNNNGGQDINNTPMAHFNDPAQGYANDNRAVLYSPIFNTQGLDTAFISFSYNFASNGANDYFEVEVWDGTDWNAVFFLNTDNCGRWHLCNSSLYTFPVAEIDITPYLNPNLQVRFIYDDGFYDDWVSFYAAIDDFTIDGFYNEDVSVTSGTAGFCSTAETVTVNLYNNGINTLTNIPLSYLVNNGSIVTETWTGTLLPGATAQYTFTTTFDGSMPIIYNISSYSSLPTDGNFFNDLATWTVDATPNYSATFTENFNNFTSTDWNLNMTVSQSVTHGMSSPAAWINLFNLFKKVEISTPRIGNIAIGDELRFNYRYVDFPNGATPTQLGNGDTLTVEVSTDCGLTFTTIGQRHGGNHTATTTYTGVSYDLSAFAGKAIVVKFTAERKYSGDYFFDLDDVYIGNAVSVGVNVTSDYNNFDVSCLNNSDGAATVTTTGIATPISAVWSNGEITNSATNLSVGQSYVTVTDANGFDFTYDFVLNAPDLPTSSVAVTSNYNGSQISCNNGSDGEATAMGIGGVSGYTYQWDANAGNQTDSTATGLSANTFTVVISDGNGCQVNDTIVLTEPTVVTSFLSSQPDLDSTNVGSVKATAQGGTPPYSYQWDANANSATTDSVANLGVGNYSVTITDANGCTATDTVNVDFLSDVFDVSEVISILKITPNPTRANVSIELELKEYAAVDLKIYNINGQLVRDLGTRHTESTIFRTDLSDFANGVYLVRIRVGGAVITRRVVLNR